MNKEKLDGILFAADMEKVFDSLEHAFIFATLAKFGFGKDYIQWTRSFLYNGSNCIMNNSFSTGCVSLERGAKQGVLFIKIRSNKAMKGFKFGKLEVRLTSLADDVTFLMKDPCSLKIILKVIKEFGTFSSLKVNVEECEACCG